MYIFSVPPDFNTYSRGMGWNEHRAHVELVMGPVVTDEAGPGQNHRKKDRKN